jgi:hypothetical protein
MHTFPTHELTSSSDLSVSYISMVIITVRSLVVNGNTA